MINGYRKLNHYLLFALFTEKTAVKHNLHFTFDLSVLHRLGSRLAQ
jgi:hypothetical protein